MSNAFAAARVWRGLGASSLSARQLKPFAAAAEYVFAHDARDDKRGNHGLDRTAMTKGARVAPRWFLNVQAPKRLRPGREIPKIPSRDSWYSWVDSNHRPPDPQSGALNQLSYSCTACGFCFARDLFRKPVSTLGSASEGKLFGITRKRAKPMSNASVWQVGRSTQSKSPGYARASPRRFNFWRCRSRRLS